MPIVILTLCCFSAVSFARSYTNPSTIYKIRIPDNWIVTTLSKESDLEATSPEGVSIVCTSLKNTYRVNNLCELSDNDLRAFTISYSATLVATMNQSGLDLSYLSQKKFNINGKDNLIALAYNISQLPKGKIIAFININKSSIVAIYFLFPDMNETNYKILSQIMSTFETL